MNKATEIVVSLNPGGHVDFSYSALKVLGSGCFTYKGYHWNAADAILTKIIGSAYEFRYFVNEPMLTVTFFRLEKPLDDPYRSYVDPDKRDAYDLVNGVYVNRNWQIKNAAEIGASCGT